MRRTLVGWTIMLHALAHSGVMMWSMDSNPWLVATLWGVALSAYLGAALGLLRFPWLRDQWEWLLMVGVVMSAIIAAIAPTFFSLVGVVVSVIIVFLALVPAYTRIDDDITAVDAVGDLALRHPRWERAGWILGAVVALYAVGVTLVRPTYLRWGTTSGERTIALPGDDVLPSHARYRVDHAITIRAPADSVWKWIVQIGQDRAGFYSHAWLERAFGAHITNANEIRDDWQTRSAGDTVFATQSGYLRGILGERPGWRVTAVVPGRAMVLENWGAFVVVPVGDTASRLIVRTRGAGERTIGAFLLAPLNVFAFEPAHFIMQRSMLHGIRDRAEGRRSTS